MPVIHSWADSERARIEQKQKGRVMKLHLIQLLTIGTIFAAVRGLAQTYAIQDLGLAPGTTYPLGQGLNDVGQACGFCETPNGPVATFSSGGQVIVLEPTSPSDIASAKGIDNSGNVVGYEMPDKADL
jgi:hypothetical protein